MTSALQTLRGCLNPRVLVALALVAVAVILFAPGLAALAIPLLILAACPLSMIAMMLAMRGHNSGRAQPARMRGPAELRAEIADLSGRRELLERELEALPADGEAPPVDAGSRSVRSGG